MDLPVLDMQTPRPATLFRPSHQGSSYHSDRSSASPAAHLFGFPSVYPHHCAPAADAAYERHAGRAMNILALPPPNSFPPAPFGRRPEPGSNSNLAPNLRSQFTPPRSEQHSYPSPPMSDSHSPARRSAHLVEPDVHSYHSSVTDARRLEGIPPPPPFDPRSATSAQGVHHQRALYPGEPQPRGQPLHYQPGRATDPPTYGGVQITQNYQYGYSSSGVPSYLGSQGPGPGPQIPAIIAPPPLRNQKPARRTKAHVASACVNCKKAHLSCDVQRPCGRCVASGKQDSCKDVQHKKRGRPRLRDDKEFGRSEEGRLAPTQLLGALPASGPESFTPQSAFSSSHRATDPLRVLGRSGRESENIANLHSQAIAQSVGGRTPSIGAYTGASRSPYAAGSSPPYQSLPIAFLDLDLVVLKCNTAFQDVLAFLGDLRGKPLADLLEARQSDSISRMRNDLRDERDERDPSYMAPITSPGQDLLQSVAERDVDQVSQGFTDRPLLLNFPLANGQYQSLQTQIRLAKTSLYFVTLVVHTPPRPAAPPLLTQQLAPPTPIRASQTLSAPTTAPTRDFGSYTRRPSSSASSAPTSPYYNFSSVRTSLPTLNSGSYGSSPSYNYSPTAGPEQGYFPTIQPPSQPTPIPRTSSVPSEGAPNRNVRLEGLQLPPIRTPQVQLPASPRSQEFNEFGRDRIRRRESFSGAERPDTPDTGKRRRLNIHEVLE